MEPRVKSTAEGVVEKYQSASNLQNIPEKIWSVHFKRASNILAIVGSGTTPIQNFLLGKYFTFSVDHYSDGLWNHGKNPTFFPIWCEFCLICTRNPGDKPNIFDTQTQRLLPKPISKLESTISNTLNNYFSFWLHNFHKKFMLHNIKFIKYLLEKREIYRILW